MSDSASSAAATPPAGDVAGEAHPAEHHEGVMPYDPEGARIGMWLFLFTEILLFGTLFIAYAVYLKMYMWQFQLASAELSIPIGGVNTLILLTSSLTMVLSISALLRGNDKLCVRLLNLTVLLALAFVVVKGFEWAGKFEHHIYPGSPELLARMKGEVVFYVLYFTMTGLHAVHVIIGIGMVLWARAKVLNRTVTKERISFLDNVGLYWHLVDLVWIFLFPLFYLIG